MIIDETHELIVHPRFLLREIKTNKNKNKKRKMIPGFCFDPGRDAFRVMGRISTRHLHYLRLTIASGLARGDELSFVFLCIYLSA